MEDTRLVEVGQVHQVLHRVLGGWAGLRWGGGREGGRERERGREGGREGGRGREGWRSDSVRVI